MTTMSALVLTTPGIEGLRVTARPVPEAGDGEVLVRVHACGVGGTVLRKVSGLPASELPRVPGHEFVGEVVAVGPGVTDPVIGDRVMGYYYVTCGRCRYCLTARESLCENGGKGDERVGENRDGAFAEFIALPARNVLSVPASLGTRAATVVIDALATPVHICERTQLRQGERMLVIGAAGGVGIHLVQLALLRGADVIAVDRKDKLAAVKEYAPRAQVRAAEDNAWIDEEWRQVDVAVDFIGRPETTPAALESLARGGRLVVLTPGAGRTFEVDRGDMVARELALLGSKYASHAQLMTAAHLLERGLVQPVITDSGDLSSATLQLERIQAQQTVGRGVIEFELAT